MKDEIVSAYEMDGELGPCGSRECLWMSDNNYAENPRIDCDPPGAKDNCPEVNKARAELAETTGATIDLYRHFNPGGKGMTLFTHVSAGKKRGAASKTKHPRIADGTHAKRVDTIQGSTTLLTGINRIVAAEHVNPQNMQYHSKKAKGQLIRLRITIR